VIGEACSTHGGTIYLHSISVGKPEGKRPIVRFGHRQEDNIDIDLK
jgi:hypothetical protein